MLGRMKSLVLLAVLVGRCSWAGQAERATFEELAARAAAARDSNDAVHAVELYKAALAVNPKWPEGWWFLGTFFYDGDRYAEGRDALRQLITLQPNAAPALQILGLCEFETGDYAAALQHIQLGMSSAASSPQMEGVLRFHRALLLTRTRQFDSALREYVWFASKEIRNPQLITALGLASLRTPLVPSEVAAGQKGLFDQAGQAAYLSISGDFPSARLALEELVKRYPDEHYVHYLWGCFLLASEPETAMNELRRELKITPGSGAANAMIAWTLLQQKEAAAALPYAKAAAEHEAEASLAQYVFGRALLEQGDVGEAILHLKKAESIDGTNLDTHVLLATAYSKAGEAAEARQERLQSLALWEGKATVGNP